MVHGQDSFSCYGSKNIIIFVIKKIMSDKRKLSDKEIEKLRKLKQKQIDNNEMIKK